MEDKNRRRNTLLLIAALMIGIAFWQQIYSFWSGAQPEKIGYTAFIAEVQSGAFKKVTVDDTQRTMRAEKKTADPKTKKELIRAYVAQYTGDENIGELLRSKGAEVEVKSSGRGLFETMLQFLPMLLFVGIAIWFISRFMNSQNRVMQFGGSKARKIEPKKMETRFSDVLGVDEAVQEVSEIVAFLKDKDRFIDIGARMPKGVLLMGPPGCGKTHLARAMAGEAGVNFFEASGSDFVEMFVGVGASRVRGMFEDAKKAAPSIVFIDEIDAVGRQRGAGLGGGHDEREQTLNQLLVEMDGFDTDSGVVLVAASNRVDILDSALTRAGRFDRQVVMPKPDIEGRRSILKLYADKIRVAEGVDLEPYAKLTMDWTGADLATFVNEAAISAASRKRTEAEAEDFERAWDKKTMGPARKQVVSEAQKRRICVHECGHSIATWFAGKTEKFHKVTALSHGNALGLTVSLPNDESILRTEDELRELIFILLAGREAEHLVLGDYSTGSENDQQRATRLAKAMVEKFAMSSPLAPASFGQDEALSFVGRDIGHPKPYSENTAAELDKAAVELLRYIQQDVDKLLQEKRAHLEAMAAALAEKQLLNRRDVEELFSQIA